MSQLWTSIAGLLGFQNAKRLSGRQAVVAGGGGIAFCLVPMMLDAGIEVHVIDRNAENLAKLVKRCRSGSALHIYEGDLTNEGAFELVANNIKKSIAPAHISILIHTAAIVNRGSVEALPLQRRRDIFEVNVLTWYSCMRFFLPEMKAQRDGHIVTFSSVVAYGAGSSASDYCGTKAAVLAMHNSMRLELIRDGVSGCIQTTIVHPYIVDTELFANAELKMKWLLPRLTAEQVAKATLDAIVYGYQTVFVPRKVMYLCLIASISPTWIQDIIYKLTGAVDFMKTPDQKGLKAVQ